MRTATLLLALLPALPALAERPVPPAPARQTGSASSTYEVRRVEGGTLLLTARNVRFDPYAELRNDRFLARVLTITTTTEARTESDGDGGRVAVTVDDLSGSAPRRVGAFTDPGTTGARHGERHFVTTARGCCAEPTFHRVRRLPDGRLLFRSTGPGPVGTAAFLQVPNGGLALRRWAAYEAVGGEGMPGVLGTLAWGGGDGTIQRLRLRHTGSSDDASTAEMRLAHGGRMDWTQPNHAPETGTIEVPAAVWTADVARGAAGIGGFSVRLLDEDRQTFAEIPVEADRLVPERATLAPGLALAAVPPTPAATGPERSPPRPTR